MKLERDQVSFFIGYLSIVVFWPRINFQPYSILVIWFPTLICYQDRTRSGGWYPYGKSFAIRILGVGIGLVWKHTDNPKMQDYNYRGNLS